jgi:hypothetical protein
MKETTLIVVLMVGGLWFAPSVSASSIVAHLNCGAGSGDDLTLWLEGTTGTCSEISSGLYECWENGSDYAKASCSTGCEEVRIGNIAGCWQGPGVPNYAHTNFTVNCPNGAKFDLKGLDGDTCEKEVNPAGVTTGGNCSKAINGATSVSTSVDCSTGCEVSTPPADCTAR